MSDPVASRSGFLCTYMSNHPDTLVAYVRHHGKVKLTVESATMTHIDTKEMSFSYVVRGSKEKKKVTIPFTPPLAGYEEVKPRLLSMKLDAEESLGMARRPQITTFQLDNGIYITIFLIAWLVFVTYSVPRPYSTIQNIGPWLREAVGGISTIRIIWIFSACVHSLEALYVAFLCKRHSTGIILGIKWVASSLILGFPATLKLRKLIQRARIDSIGKIH